jgi:drug/metabolite transporter (DMT)-like permease
MDTHGWHTVGGLTLDIFGVALIWPFGLPQNVNRGGVIHRIVEQEDPIEASKAKRYDLISALGLGLIIGGFVLQIAAQIAAQAGKAA